MLILSCVKNDPCVFFFPIRLTSICECKTRGKLGYIRVCCVVTVVGVSVVSGDIDTCFLEDLLSTTNLQQK